MHHSQNLNLIAASTKPKLPHAIYKHCPFLAAKYGMQPILYSDLPALCGEMGVQFAERPHDRPARLCVTSRVAVLYANPLFPENVRWLACFEQLGEFIGLPASEIVAFASTAALAGLALDDPFARRPVWRSDAGGHCIYFTSQLIEATGGSPLGDNWLRNVAPAQREDVAARWFEDVRAGRPFRTTIHFRHHGRTHRVDSAAQPIYAGSELIGFEGRLTAL